MKFCITLIAVLIIAFSSVGHALIIDNGTYTTDTVLGLDYLDVGLVHGDYSFFQSGVSYDGRTWLLATADQMASSWSDATGLALTTADIFSGDNDMGNTAANILIDLFDGVSTDFPPTGERVIGDYSIAGYYNFMFGGTIAVHGGAWDDSHYVGGTGGYKGAWLVSDSTDVPEPGTLALLALGLLGLGVTRKLRK